MSVSIQEPKNGVRCGNDLKRLVCRELKRARESDCCQPRSERKSKVEQQRKEMLRPSWIKLSSPVVNESRRGSSGRPVVVDANEENSELLNSSCAVARSQLANVVDLCVPSAVLTILPLRIQRSPMARHVKRKNDKTKLQRGWQREARSMY